MSCRGCNTLFSDQWIITPLGKMKHLSSVEKKEEESVQKQLIAQKLKYDPNMHTRYIQLMHVQLFRLVTAIIVTVIIIFVTI